MKTMRDILREIMRDRKLTQKEIAQMVGLKQQSVSVWLRGDGDPSIGTLLLLAEKLHIEPWELFITRDDLAAMFSMSREAMEFCRKVDRLPSEKRETFIDMMNAAITLMIGHPKEQS